MQEILRAAVYAPLPLEIQGRALPGRGDSQVCELFAKEYCLQAVHLLASAHCVLACLGIGRRACLPPHTGAAHTSPELDSSLLRFGLLSLKLEHNIVLSVCRCAQGECQDRLYRESVRAPAALME